MKRDSENLVMKNSYKDYPSDWKTIRLGGLLDVVRRPVEVCPDYEYRQIGIRSHGKGLFYKEPVKGSDLGNKSVFWVEPGCFILNIVFAWEQAVGMTTGKENGMIASHRFPMWRSKGNLDLEYLLRFFLTPIGKSLLELASPGGAGRNKTLGQDEFKKIPVCIPPSIEEQQKIVKILSTWDQAIGLKEQLITEKKQQKRWLMQNLLTGKKRLQGFEGEWQEVRLGDIGQIITGTTPSTEDKSNYGGTFPWITPTDIDTKYITFSERLLSEKGMNSVKFIPKGSILVTCIASIGKNAILCENGSCNQQINAIVCNGHYSNEFIYYIMENNVELFNKYAATTATPILNMTTFSNLKFVIPPLPEQTAIAEILSTADREIDLHEKQIKELKKQKKALMQLLLTGAVRVNTREVS